MMKKDPLNTIQSRHHAALERLERDPRMVHGGTRQDMGSTTFASINPTTGESVADLEDGGPEAVHRAVEGARQAFTDGRWAGQSVVARQEVLLAFADALVAHAEELALLDCLEMGIPIREAQADVAASAAYIRDVVGLLPAFLGAADTPSSRALAFNLFEPHGVVGAITPWNFPLNQSLVRIIPALAVGNSVVIKPSEIASLSTLRAADLAIAAGLLPGVLEVVTGLGPTTGAALASHPQIDHLSFTGSPQTGAAIQAAGRSPRSMSMELGGKSPQIICESIKAPAKLGPTIARNTFWNAGQVCSAGTRLLVHRCHAKEVIEAVVAACEAWIPGDPLVENSAAGPLATAAQHQRVIGFIERASRDGARRLTPPPTVADLALGIRPTVFDQVEANTELACEEVFGPVLAISLFSTREEAVALAHASGYGLTATVWTEDFGEAQYFARTLRVGLLTVASGDGADPAPAPALGLEPFARSGFGADYGLAGLRQYVRMKQVNFLF